MHPARLVLVIFAFSEAMLKRFHKIAGISAQVPKGRWVQYAHGSKAPPWDTMSNLPRMPWAASVDSHGDLPGIPWNIYQIQILIYQSHLCKLV